ncbi:MAG: ybbJ [Magnetococcales bacterium]|nr:ybbJ [Magnetococcales bacterium]
MHIVAYLDSHRDALWFAIGFGLLALEAGVFGFTSGILLFTGMGGVLTGLLILTGVLSGATTPAIATFSISSLILATVFWGWFRRLQKKPSAPPPPVSDIVGLSFILKQDISPLESGLERYSGIDWKVVPDPSVETPAILRGTRVEVVSLDAGVLRIRPVAGSS